MFSILYKTLKIQLANLSNFVDLCSTRWTDGNTISALIQSETEMGQRQRQKKSQQQGQAQVCIPLSDAGWAYVALFIIYTSFVTDK